jgi:hypothetical protein
LSFCPSWTGNASIRALMRGEIDARVRARTVPTTSSVAEAWRNTAWPVRTLAAGNSFGAPAECSGLLLQPANSIAAAATNKAPLPGVI